MYQQRKEPEEGAFAPMGPWQPSLEPKASGLFQLVAEAPGTYVVIDEIIEGRVGLVTAAWPQTDAGGRLAFEEEGVAVAKAFKAASLESILNRHRRRAGQTQRSLRVGDVFCVHVFDSSAPSRWRGVLDVTPAARPATKAAFLRAVVQHPSEAILEPGPVPMEFLGAEEGADLLAAPSTGGRALKRPRKAPAEEPRRPKGSSASPVI